MKPESEVVYGVLSSYIDFLNINSVAITGWHVESDILPELPPGRKEWAGNNVGVKTTISLVVVVPRNPIVRNINLIFPALVPIANVYRALVELREVYSSVKFILSESEIVKSLEDKTESVYDKFKRLT